MEKFKYLFKFFSHLFLALLLYCHQVIVTEAVATTTKEENIENAATNEQIDASGNVIALPSCSDTSAMTDFMNQKRAEFDQNFFNEYNQRKFDLRDKIDALTGQLYGTFAFTGTFAGGFSAGQRPLSEIQADLEDAQEEVDLKEDELATATAQRDACLNNPNAADPACTAEESRVTSATAAYRQAQENKQAIENELAIAQNYQDNSGNLSTRGDQEIQGAVDDYNAAMDAVDIAVSQEAATRAHKINMQENCDGDPYPASHPSCDPELQQAIDAHAQAQQDLIAANNDLKAANQARRNQVNNSVSTSANNRNNNLASDAKADELEALYEEYIDSIDNYISYAKEIEASAMSYYQEGLDFGEDNSDYDIFQGIMTEYDSDADKILNKKLIIKNLAMTGTASSAVNHLACTEITKITGVPGGTGPMGEPAVEVSSLPLFRAASAMYLASQINASSVYQDAVGGCILKCEPLVDVNTYTPTLSMKTQIEAHTGSYRMPECSYTPPNSTTTYPGYYVNDRNSNESKDEQLAAVERAANAYQKLVEVTILKRSTMEDALEMYIKAWETALQEWRDKITRVSTAQAELDQARAMLDSTNTNIMYVLLAIAIATAILISCSTTPPNVPCIVAMSAIIAALLIFLAMLRNDQQKYQNEIEKWENELKRAQVHAMLDCHFPGWKTPYSSWDRAKTTNSTISSSLLGEDVDPGPGVQAPSDDPNEHNKVKKMRNRCKNDPDFYQQYQSKCDDLLSFQENPPIDQIQQRIVQQKSAPLCSKKDSNLASSLFQAGNLWLLNLFFAPVQANVQDQTTPGDNNEGNALGLRGNEDVVDKTTQGQKTDTTLFEIMLSLKLHALKIQSYNPLDEGLVNLKENPVKVKHLRPQDVKDLGLYLYRLVSLNKLNKNNAMTFYPPKNGEGDEENLNRPTNTGFPLVETRHFYIQSVIWQLQDLIAELNAALGRNCGVIGPQATQAQLSVNPDQTDADGVTTSSLCDQRDYYTTLLYQMRHKMRLGDVGLDDEKVEAPGFDGSGTCMKQSNTGEFVIDRECQCKKTNTCASFEYPQFATINTTASGETRLVIDEANAYLSGDTAQAELIAGNLSASSSAIRKRVRDLKNLFDEKQNSIKNTKKDGLSSSLSTGAKLVSTKNNKNTSTAKHTGFFSFLNSDSKSDDKGLTEEQKKQLALAIAAKKKELEQSKQKGAKEKSAATTPAKANQISLDFNFGDDPAGEGMGLDFSDFSEKKKLTTLQKLHKKESEKQDVIYKSFQNNQPYQYRKKASSPYGSGVNTNSSRSIFKIISKRYQKTAFPLFLKGQRRR